MSNAPSNSVSGETIPSKAPMSRTGFAFGGVAGFNAHNAGVLQAMLKAGISPAVITCTSGAMWWVYQYLKVRTGQINDDLRDQIKTEADASKGINGMTLAASGLPGIFRPATAEYLARWWQPWPGKDMSLSAEAVAAPGSAEYWQQPLMTEFFNRLLPAQSFVPTRPDTDFSDIANTFNAPGAPPILFNVYDVQNGWEIVYGNQQALDLILGEKDKRTFRNQHTQERAEKPYSADVPQTTYARISEDAVRQALWLLCYGLDGHPCIDGAYRRQIILSELTMCNKVYVVKPEPCRINQADLPTNYFGVQDFQTEMWLNSSYDSEIADLSHHAARHAYKHAMKRAHKALPSPVPDGEPETIEVVPISRDQPLGYFNYFVEQLSNFDAAYAKALGDFDQTKPLPSVQIFSAI